MWKAILLSLLFWVLPPFSYSETVPSISTSNSNNNAVYGWSVYNRGGWGVTREEGCKSYNSTWVLVGGPEGVNDFYCRNPATGTQAVMYQQWGCPYGGNVANVNGVMKCNNMPPVYACPATGISMNACGQSSFGVYTISADKTTCTRPDPTPDQVTCFCETLSKNHQLGLTKGGCWADGRLPSTAGCYVGMSITIGTKERLEPADGFEYTGEACNPTCSSGDNCSIDTTTANTETGMGPVTEKPINSQADCKANETFGQLNGKNVCVKNAPKAGEGVQITSDGKNADGNCAAGYYGVIDNNNNFVCIKKSDLDPNKTTGECANGGTKMTYGDGKSVCVGGTAGTSSSTGEGQKTGTGAGSGGASGEDECKAAMGVMAFMFCGSQEEMPEPDLKKDNLGKSDSIGVGDISSTDRLFGGGAACPQPKTFDISMGGISKNFEITYQPLCDFASALKPLLIGIGFLIAAFIVLKRG